MKIKLIEKRKPGTKTGPGKFYANPVNIGCKTLKDIAGRSSLTRGDIENVLENKKNCRNLISGSGREDCFPFKIICTSNV